HLMLLQLRFYSSFFTFHFSHKKRRQTELWRLFEIYANKLFPCSTKKLSHRENLLNQDNSLP
ncbi:hypothetical protein MMR74_26730, partial [Escherichia coli]|nr:hypothetical protein [Escherichia coli]